MTDEKILASSSKRKSDESCDKKQKTVECRHVKMPAKTGFQIGLPEPISNEYWFADVPLTPGTIGQFCADRALPWDAFVVIGVTNPDKTHLDVIFPRIRWDETKRQLLFGADKLNEADFKYVAKCTCEIYQGCDFVCGCGAADKNVAAYANIFKEAGPDTVYQVATISSNPSPGAWLEYPPNHKQLAKDLPLYGTHCIACRDSHA